MKTPPLLRLEKIIFQYEIKTVTFAFAFANNFNIERREEKEKLSSLSEPRRKRYLLAQIF
jgi:hypothetical protein